MLSRQNRRSANLDMGMKRPKSRIIMIDFFGCETSSKPWSMALECLWPWFSRYGLIRAEVWFRALQSSKPAIGVIIPFILRAGLWLWNASGDGFRGVVLLYTHLPAAAMPVSTSRRVVMSTL